MKFKGWTEDRNTDTKIEEWPDNHHGGGTGFDEWPED